MDAHSLTIVIPALNEEEAIGDTLRRCLDARDEIRTGAGLERVEVVVVSDGSSDRTEEIALGFDQVSVLAFDRNRGYGAAIKAGFAYGSGDLVGFLDADGTCDPRVFGPLCRALEREEADVALGARMTSESEMPWVRALGNRLFAWMLGVLSKRLVRDTASGMRVIRRSSLRDLEPLPDGLHFTPAMSARVLLEDKLRLVEVPMPYAERLGRSKLSVLRDGVRFLSVIVRAAMCYRPARLLLLVAGALLALGLVVGAGPVAFWLGEGRLEEWMIYRVLLSALLFTGVALVLCAAVVAEEMAATAHGRPAAASGVGASLARAFRPAPRRAVGALLVLVALGVAAPGIAQYAAIGEVTMHWSRAVLASLLVVLAGVLGITAFLLDMLDLIRAQRLERGPLRPPDRARPAVAA